MISQVTVFDARSVRELQTMTARVGLTTVSQMRTEAKTTALCTVIQNAP